MKCKPLRRWLISPQNAGASPPGKPYTLTLSMATMAFGLFWLIWILMSTITRGIDGMSLALFTEMTPPPEYGRWWSGERPGG
ncbi:hypothetical protein ACLBOM_02235 [Escherichia coli]